MGTYSQVADDDDDYWDDVASEDDETMSMPSQADIARDPSRASMPETPANTTVDHISAEMNDFDVVKIAGQDQTAMDFVEAMREQGMAPSSMRQALEWHANEVKTDQANIDWIDNDSYESAMVDLNNTWGPQTEANLEGVRNLFRSAPDGIFDAVSSARLPDGTVLGSDPAFLKWAHNLIQSKPQAQRQPVQHDDDAAGRIKEIESFMREHRTAYNRDTAIQQELLALYAQREQA